MRLIGIVSCALLTAQAVTAQVTTTTLQVQQPTQPGQITPGQPTMPQRMPARPLRPGETPPKGTGVIKGQVMAAGTGSPVRRAQVRAFSMEGGGGVTNTDNEGRFEIKELPSGRYNVTATKGGFVQGSFGQRRAGEPGTPLDLGDGQTAEKVNFVLSRGGVISGRIVDDGGEPVSGTQVMAMRFQFMSGARRLVPGGGEGSNDRTDDQGSFRLYGLPPGEYYVSASNRSGMNMVMPGVTSTEADGFAPTYYPGTPNLAEASRVPLKAGQEMSGANFALVVARMARLRGRALNSRGEPVSRSMLMMTPADPSLGMSFGMNINNAMVQADGSFEFRNVPPGRYNLNVRPNGMPGANDEFAVIPVNVGNEDIDNLIVSTSVGATATGVILTDDGSVPPFRADQVQMFASPMEPVMGPMMGSGPPRIRDDYTFEMTGLFDRRIIRGSAGMGQSIGWSLKAVLFDGQDVTDTGIEFTPGRSYEGIQLVFTQKMTDLSGLVTDDRGKPVLDATVVVFPMNKERWTFQTRFIRTARPDTNGRYSFRNLPPADDYMMIAVQNLESGQASDPEFLNRALNEAKSFTLNEGETKAIDVRLSPLVP